MPVHCLILSAVTCQGFGLLHQLHATVPAQVSLKTANGSTALHNAATNGHDAIVELLMMAGSSVNSRAVSGATPLYGAASGGHLTVVRRLLDAGAEVRTAMLNAAAPVLAEPSAAVVQAVHGAGCAEAHARLQ